MIQVDVSAFGACSARHRPCLSSFRPGRRPTVARQSVDDDLVVETDLTSVSEEPPQTAAATAKLVAERRERIQELAEWDQLDRTQRRTLGVPVSDAEWAKVKGLNVRRVSKYRADPFYDQCVEKLRSITRKRIAPGGSATLADLSLTGMPGVDDVSDYTAIKTQVASLARQGDQRALDMWLKHWGKPFLDEETSNRVADLAGMSDEEIVTGVVELVNPVLLADVLRGHGWVVNPPPATGAARFLANSTET